MGFSRMAQESWKVNGDEMGCQPPEGPILCSNNCGFFGSSATMNLCSQCYRDVLMKQAKAAEVAAAISAARTQPSLEAPPQHEEVAAVVTMSSQADAAMASDAPKPLSQLLPPPAKVNRCCTCNKRVGLTGFKCRCGGLFCSLHRYNDKHDCSFDYKAAAQDSIRKANPVIKADKVDKI